jgi:hypothetical protein
MIRHRSGAVSFQKEIATMSKPKRLHAVDLRASWARLTPQTVLLLDGSIVLNFYYADFPHGISLLRESADSRAL